MRKRFLHQHSILKKLSSKHQELAVVESGLVINQKWPFLGASPDRIHFCKCHGKTLVECKSLFSKRNLLQGIAASEKLIKTTKRLPAEGRDHLVLPDTGPDGHYRNSSHRSGYLHKQGYPDCLSEIQ